MKENPNDWALYIGMAIGVLLWAAALFVPLFVVVHFIIKFW
jgi:hypothetical protein